MAIKKPKIVQRTKNNKHQTDGIVVQFADNSYTFSVSSSNTNWSDEMFSANQDVNWDTLHQPFGGYDIIPYGMNNNLPAEIRLLMDYNNLAPGIINRKVKFLWGQGPALYKIEYINGDIKKTFVEDVEILSWLEGIDYKNYLRKIMNDYEHAEGCASKLFRNKGVRVGSTGKITKIEHVSLNNFRLIWPGTPLAPVAQCLIGEFEMIYNLNNFTSYNLYDKQNPFKNPVSVIYSNLNSFARNYYNVPSYFGTFNWIKRSSDIPKIFKSLTDNALSIKWHIESPSSYWENKKVQIQENCALTGKTYTNQQLEELKDKTFKSLSEVLSGVKNVGKFFTSEFFINQFGNPEGWKITPIDQKVKEFIDAQVSIAEKADSATTSGLGLHPSLSNIMVNGKLASGSEQLYALKIHLTTETDIPEDIVCEAINEAIKINWPSKKLKLGFYHDIVKTEDNVNNADRVKNKV